MEVPPGRESSTHRLQPSQGAALGLGDVTHYPSPSPLTAVMGRSPHLFAPAAGYLSIAKEDQTICFLELEAGGPSVPGSTGEVKLEPHLRPGGAGDVLERNPAASLSSVYLLHVCN